MKQTPYRLIVIDGPRGVGKSTVGQELVKNLTELDYQATYFKKVIRSEENELQNMQEHLLAWKQIGGIVVVDRFFASEWVMSMTLNRRQDLTALTHECLKMAAEVKSAGFGVILSARAEVLDSRIEARGTRGWDISPVVTGPMWRAAAGTFDQTYIDTSDKTVDEVQRTLLVATVIGLAKQITQALEVVE